MQCEEKNVVLQKIKHNLCTRLWIGIQSTPSMATSQTTYLSVEEVHDLSISYSG